MAIADEPILVTNNLYLGNFNAAEYARLIKNNISAVVCLTKYSHDYISNLAKDNPEQNQQITLLHINNIGEDLAAETFTLDKLLKAISFINSQTKLNKNVLVHCKAGASRSPTVIIGYLMQKFDLNVAEACLFLKQKAYYINPTFISLLEEYYKFLQSRPGTDASEELYG